MSICHRCGKTLSTKQALNYHLMNVCSNAKHKSNLDNIYKNSFKDVELIYDYRGNIIHIMKKNDKMNEFKIGTNIFDYVDEINKYECLYKHMELAYDKKPKTIKFKHILGLITIEDQEKDILKMYISFN